MELTKLGWRAAAPDAPAVTAPARQPSFVSSSAFMLFNLLPFENPPGFAQLNLGLGLTPSDVLIVEAITWKYHAPLGIPLHRTGDPKQNFPGHARDYGVGLAWQHFWWRGVYTTVHATPFVQNYVDEQGELIQTGFQLFTTARVGGRIRMFQQRLFLEPSFAWTAWPINTNLPASFQRKEDQWPWYFLTEPGLHVGVTF